MGAIDPAEPWCAGHLHCPPLAVAAAAEIVGSVLNPSMDSWDQAPSSTELERLMATEFAQLVHPRSAAPDTLVTTGGSESNLLGLLLARERARREDSHPLQVVRGANAHHSVDRAVWLLGLPTAQVVACPEGRLEPEAVAAVLDALEGPAAVIATAGTTDTGEVDPLAALAEVTHSRGGHFHVDGAYGGMALLSDTLRPLLAGIELADTVALDLHKLGWQPVAAGLLTVSDGRRIDALNVRADYLNSTDDTEAGQPDLLARSVRTTRRPDVFKMAVTFRALGRSGLGQLVDKCCATADELAQAITARPALRLWRRPRLSTVLFRPVQADTMTHEDADRFVGLIRRELLERGAAVLARARAPEKNDPAGLWLKCTLLNPHTTAADYEGLLDAVEQLARQLFPSTEGGTQPWQR
ncbi:MULTISPECIES: pyridoxal phosphate-dependent decarboxylase family protein [unclassified Streptomyces]|uniref:pyridoxal phosphate-dependent decarboxylase family protein n=1 Tax=Streptomyces sp. NPDC127532 TaxID=3345399 RepID=UPI003636F02D